MSAVSMNNGRKRKVMLTNLIDQAKKNVVDTKNLQPSCSNASNSNINVTKPLQITLSKRAKNSVPIGQPKLMDYVNEKEVESTLISSIQGSSQVKTKMPKIAQSGKLFILMLGTSDCTVINPFIMVVNEGSIPEDYDKREVYKRFRISHKPYAARIVSSSENREDLESSYHSAIDSWINSPRGHVIKAENVIYSCSKPINLLPLSDSDLRVMWLKSFLITGKQVDDENDALSLDSECNKDNYNYWTDNKLMDDDEDGYDDPNKILQSLAKGGSEEVNAMYDKTINNTENIRNNQTSINDDNQIQQISSDDDSELKAQKPKKRRVRKFTDDKLVVKLREDRAKSIEEANSDIIYAMEKLDEAIPTLPVQQQYTPIIKSLYKIVKALNSKVNWTQGKKSFTASLPLNREISLEEIEGQDAVCIANKITLPMSGLSKAIANPPDRPCLIISRIIRYCFTGEIKKDCEVNDDADETNFLWRIADSNLDGQDRVRDGREIITVLTEFAYKVMEEEVMPIHALNESLSQVQKALYDYNLRIKKAMAISKPGHGQNASISVDNSEPSKQRKN